MKFPHKLIGGRLIRRYKRFLADVVLDNNQQHITAHCPNTGSMKSCAMENAQIYLSYNPSPKRKLAYTWELTQTQQGYVGVHTGRPNQVVAESLRSIPEFDAFHLLQKEKKFGDSRIDLLLQGKKKLCYVEIKNVTLLEKDTLYFPDAVTKRGQKHLDDLIQLAKQGHRAVLFFFVNRPEGNEVRPAFHIDPLYAKKLRSAAHHGVEVIAYRARHSLEEIQLGERVKVRLA
ncbi:MAG: DNA/RNA nuclease SfsA [Planctomycetota bacterium]|nr:MAG: DNA/RNA nuclease SfsA [Planctomycetota bacterium]